MIIVLATLITLFSAVSAKVDSPHAGLDDRLPGTALDKAPSPSTELENPVEETISLPALTASTGASMAETTNYPTFTQSALTEATLPGGASLSVKIDDPADGSELPFGTITVKGTAGIRPAVTPNIALVYLIDVSGSVNVPTYPGCHVGDQNNDGYSDLVLDCEIYAFKELNQRAYESGLVREAGVAIFGMEGKAADVGPAGGDQLITGLMTDEDSSAEIDLEQVISSVFDPWVCKDNPEDRDNPFCSAFSGVALFTPRHVGLEGTDYAEAIRAALTVANASTAPVKIVIFLSDGGNNEGDHVNTVLPAGNVIFYTFALGEFAYCSPPAPYPPNRYGDLETVANLTGGTCTRVSDLQNLPDDLQNIINLNSQLVSLEMTVDGIAQGAPAVVRPGLPQDLIQGGVVEERVVEFETPVSGLSQGSHVICVTAAGSDLVGSATATDCHTIVIDAPPAVDAGPDVSGKEGIAIPLTGAVFDLESSPAIHWGVEAGADVDAGTVCTFTDAGALDTALTCSDDGSYRVILTADDGINLPVSDSAAVTVKNVPPDIQISAPVDGTVIEIGEDVTLQAGFSDLGTNDTHTCTIDWGDGTPVALGGVAEAGGTGTCVAAHSYAVGVSFTIRVVIADDDSGSVEDAVYVTTNIPPDVDAGPDVMGLEGSAISLAGAVFDPDSFPVLHWEVETGAGVDAGAICSFTDADAAGTAVTCSDDGSYQATLTAEDGINLPVSDTVQVTVSNVPPAVQISTPADGTVIPTGETVNLEAKYSDPGANDTHICTIDWGDGTPADPGEVAGTGGSGSCTGAHSYAGGGPFSIRVVITDDDDGSGEDAVTIRTNHPPVCSAARPSIGVIWPPNQQFVPVQVLDVSDPDGDRVLILITGIFQDEPVDTFGDGNFTPDAMGLGTDTAQLRAERSGTKKVPGDGRVYHIAFDAVDGLGGACSGSIQVVVPHDQASPAVDGGPAYDSTAGAPK